MLIEDDFDDNEVEFSYDELLEVFQDLYHKFKILKSNHITLKKKNIDLSN